MTGTASASATRSHACRHNRHECVVSWTSSDTNWPVCPTIRRRALRATGPTLLVPEEGQRRSFEAKDASECDDERELSALQTAVGATYSAPAVMSRETVLLSPPSGTFETELSAPPSSIEYGRAQKRLLCGLGQYPPRNALSRAIRRARVRLICSQSHLRSLTVRQWHAVI